jgi:hypothetical protein
MFERFNKFWQEYGFEACVIGSILIIFFLALFRIGKKGTWSKSLPKEYMNVSKKRTKKGNKNSELFGFFDDNYNSTSSRGPPKESKGEKECRKVLEEIFGEPFPKARPDILRNFVTSEEEDIYNLELDCYNPSLKIACEYNGIQHYKFSPFFHKTRETFHNQKYRDYMKRDLCNKNGIFLIEVPHTVKNEDIRAFIIEKLKIGGFIRN